MAFDPTQPVEETQLDAVLLRSQFNGLKDLIDAIPPGAAMRCNARNIICTVPRFPNKMAKVEAARPVVSAEG